MACEQPSTPPHTTHLICAFVPAEAVPDIYGAASDWDVDDEDADNDAVRATIV